VTKAVCLASFFGVDGGLHCLSTCTIPIVPISTVANRQCHLERGRFPAEGCLREID